MRQSVHHRCQTCLENRWRAVHGNDAPAPLIHAPEEGICCWCGAVAPVATISFPQTNPPFCPGHGQPTDWTLEDYARAIISEYRLGRAHQELGRIRYAPADILTGTTLEEAINALEEAL